MQTKVFHNRGKYNLLNPSQITEEYTFVFDESDKENKTVVFSYDDDGPQLDPKDYTVLELLEELSYCPSRRMLFSSSYNHIEEKSHEERMEMAKKFALTNAPEDDKARAEMLIKEAEKLENSAQRKREIAKSLLVE